MYREPGPAEFPVVRADSPPSELWSAVQGLLGENGALRAENEKQGPCCGIGSQARAADQNAGEFQPSPLARAEDKSAGGRRHEQAHQGVASGHGAALERGSGSDLRSQGHGLSALYGRRDGRGPDGAAGLRPHRGAADQAADHAGPPPWGLPKVWGSGSHGHAGGGFGIEQMTEAGAELAID